MRWRRCSGRATTGTGRAPGSTSRSTSTRWTTRSPRASCRTSGRSRRPQPSTARSFDPAKRDALLADVRAYLEGRGVPETGGDGWQALTLNSTTEDDSRRIMARYNGTANSSVGHGVAMVDLYRIFERYQAPLRS